MKNNGPVLAGAEACKGGYNKSQEAARRRRRMAKQAGGRGLPAGGYERPTVGTLGRREPRGVLP